MKLARVVGSISSPRKDRSLDGLTMVVVNLLDADMNATSKTAACIDALGARKDDVVLLCSSSSARMTEATKHACVDTTVVAIVDSVSSGKKDLYHHHQSGQP